MLEIVSGLTFHERPGLFPQNTLNQSIKGPLVN